MSPAGVCSAGVMLLLAAASPEPAAPRAAAPGSMQLRQMDERAWEAATREKLAPMLKVAPDELRFSRSKRLVAFVVGPPPPAASAAKPRRPRRPAPPPRFHIFVADVTGKLQGGWKPVTVPHGSEPPKDLRFLDDERLVYEVVLPPPPPTKPPPRIRGKAARRGAPPAAPAAAAMPEPERHLFVIQPVVRRARPVRCEGFGFAFAPKKDHLAFVTGARDAASIAIDGKKLYPRRGRTTIAAAPAWSPDGAALAFVELPPGRAPRLVMVPDFDEASTDTTWDLPPTIAVDAMQVFWAGAGKLVVGKTPTSPVFATSFELQRPAE